MNPVWPEMIGNKYGHLTVIRAVQGIDRTLVYCRCECGNFVTATPSPILRGRHISCGCDLQNRNRDSATHGHSRGKVRTPEYTCWLAMKSRCQPSNRQAWKYYGARGIKVCARWENSFENFLADMGPRLSPTHSIDRYPNNDGNYESTNCRWATKREQMLNRRKYTMPNRKRGKK